MEFLGRLGVYEVGERLGGGGMAEVFKGKSKDGSIEVAIKKPLSSLSSEYRALFLREAEAASRAAGQGVVRVVDWGDNPSFIAYELVGDPTLEREIEQRRAAKQPWSANELTKIFDQLACALRTINQHVLHRDLKPANIFIGADQVRVGDFGLAKYVDEATRSRTFKGWGTTPYMPPEAWRGSSLDWRADQYALGVVFFELATLTRLFSGSDDELEQMHLYNQPPRADAVTAQVPPRLASLIAKMLAKRTEDRFASWDAIVAEVTAAEQSLAGPQKQSQDPIAQMFVNNLNAHKQRQLETTKAEDERARLRKERRALIAYWWKQYADAIRDRLDRLNQEAGDQAITFTVKGSQLDAKFLNAQLTFHLDDIPPDAATDVLGWGVLRTTKPKSICVSQLLLLKNPEPYGTWVDVYMEVNPLIQRALHPSELSRDQGGRYEIVGAKRLVVALGYSGLLEQRAIRHAMGLVQYREGAFDFQSSVDDCLRLFVQDAAAQRPSDRFPWG